MSTMKDKILVKDGSRNYFIAEANLKDGSSNFSNGKKNEENTENAAEERDQASTRTINPLISESSN